MVEDGFPVATNISPRQKKDFRGTAKLFLFVSKSTGKK